jgi:hypothetical protein
MTTIGGTASRAWRLSLKMYRNARREPRIPSLFKTSLKSKTIRQVRRIKI